jgi:hypothetical protein
MSWHKTSSKKCVVQTDTQVLFSKRKEVNMVKKILQFMLAGLVIGVLPLAAEQNKGPEEILLKGKEARDVSFNHRTHQNALGDCNLCHNRFPQAQSSIQKLISDGKLKVKEVMEECRACHRQREGKGEKTGPAAQCSGCHKKAGG